MPHTPGPWHVGHSQVTVFADDGAIKVATVDAYKVEDCAANARLIAAAPDLLEACERSLAVYDAMIGIFGDSAFTPPMLPWRSPPKGHPDSLRVSLVAAIAKARGI